MATSIAPYAAEKEGRRRAGAAAADRGAPVRRPARALAAARRRRYTFAMRLWSLHPRYLDAKGLVALWREALLAKAVLAGRTKGYRSHPQLDRFRAAADPAEAIRSYLEAVLTEAGARGYSFDARKIGRRAAASASGAGASPASEAASALILVTRGQLDYEKAHLMSKLAARDPKRRAALAADAEAEAHPLFRVVEGGIEDWEVGARRP
jgi:hypothetical protein